jgi:hypothetical protein
MPTRIVLRETDAPPAASPRKRIALSGFHHQEQDVENPPRRPVFETPDRKTSPVSPLSPRATSSRKVVSFRSSILREAPQKDEEQKRGGLSTTDIRASPRLLGYVFQLLASSVMLITVIQFYRQQENNDFVTLFTNSDGEKWDRRIYTSVNGPVYYWKFIGCMATGSLGSGISLLVVLLHFDTICLPRVWVRFFRDGSQIEHAFLLFLLLFWAVGLYVCTSTLSVGEVQANVYFTTWIAFVSALLNCGVWRVSAGRPSLAEKINLHHRETTYNWIWTLCFLFIFAGAATDIYLNRDEITFRLKGEVLVLSQRDWLIILSIVWAFVGICLLALLFNHYLTKEVEVKFCGGRRRFVLGWRQFEGIIILAMVGVFFWIIYTQTGANGVINGLNNGYFSVWGAFFNSVFTFGTWLRENKDIEYIVRDDDGDEHRRAGR